MLGLWLWARRLIIVLPAAVFPTCPGRCIGVRLQTRHSRTAGSGRTQPFSVQDGRHCKCLRDVGMRIVGLPRVLLQSSNVPASEFHHCAICS